MLYEATLKFDDAPLRARGVKLFPMPLLEIAQKEGGSRIMMNTAALGAVPVSELRAPVANLRERRADVQEALDALFGAY